MRWSHGSITRRVPALFASSVFSVVSVVQSLDLADLADLAARADLV